MIITDGYLSRDENLMRNGNAQRSPTAAPCESSVSPAALHSDSVWASATAGRALHPHHGLGSVTADWACAHLLGCRMPLALPDSCVGANRGRIELAVL